MLRLSYYLALTVIVFISGEEKTAKIANWLFEVRIDHVRTIMVTALPLKN
jgi:hypothetical protein